MRHRPVAPDAECSWEGHWDLLLEDEDRPVYAVMLAALKRDPRATEDYFAGVWAREMGVHARNQATAALLAGMASLGWEKE